MPGFSKRKKEVWDAYHAYIIPCILFGVRLVSRYIRALTMIRMKISNKILFYLEAIFDFGLDYYSDSIWG